MCMVARMNCTWGGGGGGKLMVKYIIEGDHDFRLTRIEVTNRASLVDVQVCVGYVVAVCNKQRKV